MIICVLLRLMEICNDQKYLKVYTEYKENINYYRNEPHSDGGPEIFLNPAYPGGLRTLGTRYFLKCRNRHQ